MPDAMPDPSPSTSAPEDGPGAQTSPRAQSAAEALRGNKTIVLVGLMGAGKTTVGKALAALLNLPFRDADSEIEKAAGLSVSEIFAQLGETEFRRGERRVIRRLLNEETPHILATGGGAFADPETRALIKARAVSVWLRAEMEALLRRVARKNTRPLLRDGDPRAILTALLAERGPAYAEADVTVDSNDGAVGDTVKRVIAALHAQAGDATAPEAPEAKESGA
jgi:shikimate kinase